ncbi:NAD-dependent epimerase/dehydratase family protein [Deinococcus detaillensis]|uniref:NAD-dependent epimerase/dehydratase family protein n=1 Tax=Deinococcus detaillensis TaxID=2592048 RepID=A0A553UMQ7_9DEIO|nr:NAD-dependent epimerase/dehydratase family protein [Deinococcus detaillensis]TSA81455.1 NAD-dependent epimerase/dehydratase family protein [Deinococcus detaillensis]
MHRMLISGGAGFIGSHVARRAQAAGYHVTVIDNLSSGKMENLPEGVTFVHVDVRDRASVLDAVMAAAPDVISHQAAQVSVSESVQDPHFDAAVNIIGLLNVLEAARQAGTRRIVFASSGGAIYGEVPEGQRAQVEWQASPISPYAVSKLAGEGYLQAYRAQFGLEFTSLRYANVYGPRQNPHGEAGVVAVFVNRLLAGQALQINAMETLDDDGCIRDYVYVADVARANILAAAGVLPDVINIGTGIPVSTRTLAETIAELGGLKLELMTGPHRAGDIKHSQIDPAVCEHFLGEMTALRTGLVATIESFRAALATPF